VWKYIKLFLDGHPLPKQSWAFKPIRTNIRKVQKSLSIPKKIKLMLLHLDLFMISFSFLIPHAMLTKLIMRFSKSNHSSYFQSLSLSITDS